MKLDFMELLALVTIVMSFIIFGMLFFFGIHPDLKEDKSSIIVAIITMDVLILSYFYGSSKGSSDKNAQFLKK